MTVSRGVIATVVSGSGNLEPARQLDVNFDASGQDHEGLRQGGRARQQGRAARAARRPQRPRSRSAKAHADLVDARGRADHARRTPRRARRRRRDRDGDRERRGRAATARRRRRARRRQPRAAASDASATALTRTATAAAPPSPRPPARRRRDADGDGDAARGGLADDDRDASGGDSPSGGDSTQSVESAQAAVDTRARSRSRRPRTRSTRRCCGRRSPAPSPSVTAGVGDTPGGETAFITLAQLSKLKLEVALSESDIGKVEVGQAATVTVNAASGRGRRRARDVGRRARERSLEQRDRERRRRQLSGRDHARPDHGRAEGRDERDGGHRRRARHRARGAEPGAARLDRDRRARRLAQHRSASDRASSATA